MENERFLIKNPTPSDKVRNCFFCSHEIQPGETFGKILEYVICEECYKQMTSGIPLIAIEENPSFENQTPICILETEDGKSINQYPTGEWVVFSKEALKQLISEETIKVLFQMHEEKGVVFVLPTTLKSLVKCYEDMKLDTDENSEKKGT